MLHTMLQKLSAPDRVRGATDDEFTLGRPKTEVTPITLFGEPPTPNTPDPFDDFDSCSNHQMRSLLPERANRNETFTYAIDWMSFNHLFKLFSKFGDSRSTGETITLTNSDKWFRQAKVIDNRRISTTDTGIYFKQIAKSKKALNMQEYEQFLDFIAKKKGINPSEMRYKMTSCGPPKTTKTTEVDNRSAIKRLTDNKRYTGTHRYWLDKMGKGRGLEDSEDFFDNRCYVYGYKSQGTFHRFQ